MAILSLWAANSPILSHTKTSVLLRGVNYSRNDKREVHELQMHTREKSLKELHEWATREKASTTKQLQKSRAWKKLQKSLKEFDKTKGLQRCAREKGSCERVSKSYKNLQKSYEELQLKPGCCGTLSLTLTNPYHYSNYF